MLKNEVEKAKMEAEKARDEAEQQGYDLGVAETKETLRAKVPTVCCIYCTQTWDEAFNRAGVEAFLDPLPPNQLEQTKEPKAPKETFSDKATEVLEDGIASQGFEQALASVTMLAGEAPKDKEEIVPAEADKIAGKTSKDKIQIKLKQ